MLKLTQELEVKETEVQNLRSELNAMREDQEILSQESKYKIDQLNEELASMRLKLETLNDLEKQLLVTNLID